MNADRLIVTGDSTELRPPGQPLDPVLAAPASRRWPWLILGLLVLVALAVVFALPAVLERHDDAAVATHSPPAPAVDANSEAARAAANQALQDYLRLRARLALANAAAWGEPEWSGSAARVSAADRQFAQHQFSPAARGYREALELLERVEAARGVLLARALEEAALALEQGALDRATSRFEAALAIAPDHPEATNGLARAGRRGASIAKLEIGSAAEARNDLASAYDAYRQAAQLDPDHDAAQTALERTAGLIEDRDFRSAMTRALAALDAGRSTEADSALAEAERLRPDDPVVHDARQRLQLLRTGAALQGLRREAEIKVRAEDWSSAAALYRKALALDAAAGFARTGLGLAEERLKLHAQLDHYLDDTARLYAAAPLSNARQLLAGARQAPADEPRLGAKIGALRERVTLAETPLTVTLHSDGATSVSVYRVGRLGTFETRRLEMLPGDYTVVGSRPGYRDVRRVLRLRPGVAVPPLVVRCEESI